jgi:hypothetical protein
LLSLRALQAVRKHLAEQGDSLGIPIYIEELTKRDKLFHQYKTVTAMSDWQRENITCSPVLCDIGEEPAYDALLAKVHPTRYISYLTLQVHKGRAEAAPARTNRRQRAESSQLGISRSARRNTGKGRHGVACSCCLYEPTVHGASASPPRGMTERGEMERGVHACSCTA